MCRSLLLVPRLLFGLVNIISYIETKIFLLRFFKNFITNWDSLYSEGRRSVYSFVTTRNYENWKELTLSPRKIFIPTCTLIYNSVSTIFPVFIPFSYVSEWMSSFGVERENSAQRKAGKKLNSGNGLEGKWINIQRIFRRRL